MTKQEATDKAIERIKGQEVEPGKVVASQLDPITYKFIRYDGDDAIVESVDGSFKTFPRSEIFDVNKLVTVALHYLNLGFWKEGLECAVISIKK